MVPSPSELEEPPQPFFWFDPAGSAPDHEFSQVHSTISRLAVVDPGLRLPHVLAQVALGETRLLPHLPEQGGNRPISETMLRL